MKKTILLFVLIICSFSSFAQDAMYGVRTGINISNLDFDPEVPNGIENQHRNGFVLGFFAEYALSKEISLAPELQFSSEGAKEEALRIDYLQLPVFFKYKLSHNLRIGLGPQASLKAHENEDGLKNISFSALGGLEYLISDEFFLDFRYTYGLTNIFDDELNLDAKNTNMQFGVGLKF